MPSPRILIVEDEWIVSEEIKELLQQSNYDVVGQAEDSTSALEIINTSKVDIALMDINIKGPINGIDLAMEIRLVCNCSIIFLTAYDDKQFLSRAKLVKPAAYIVKPFEERNLKAAIEIAFDNHEADLPLKGSQNSSNIKQAQLRAKLPLVEQLTQREKEILILVSKGLSAKEIADQLFISLHTVKTHRKNLWNKLEVENFADLIRISDHYM